MAPTRPWSFSIFRSAIDGGGAEAYAKAHIPGAIHSDYDKAVNSPTPKIFTATIDRRLIADTSDVEQARERGPTLIDARPATFFLGREKAPSVLACGHIAAALNLDHSEFYDAATNRLKPAAELAALAARIPAGRVIAYCNTGHWAATDWFVLSDPWPHGRGPV